MAPRVERFLWYDLMTPDAAGAAAFYGAVLGWTTRAAGPPGRPYLVLSSAEGVGLGGVVELPAQDFTNGARPGWLGYVAVEDVDATASRIVSAGGAIYHAPEDLPAIGRFAVVADPQGAAFILFRGDGMAPPVVARDTPGHVFWHELRCPDPVAGFAFYAGLFGWTADQAIDLGAGGVYQNFAIAGVPQGGVMRLPDAGVPPHWLFYVLVDGLDAAAARVRQAGGDVLLGPHAVPGGHFVLVGRDPQSAVFALVSATA